MTSSTRHIEPIPVAQAANNYLNPAAIQQVIIVRVEPLLVITVWPTGTQLPLEGEPASEVLRAWGLLDKDGNLGNPEGIQTAINEAALLAGVGNGNVQSLRPE